LERFQVFVEKTDVLNTYYKVATIACGLWPRAWWHCLLAKQCPPLVSGGLVMFDIQEKIAY